MYRVDTVQMIQDMARGAVLLGTGGGGDPYIGELFVTAQIRKGHAPRVVSCDEVAPDAFVLSIAGIGAPSVIVEHLVSERTLRELLARSEKFYGRRIDALISAEIGGANSMFPLALSSISDIPVLDAADAVRIQHGNIADRRQRERKHRVRTTDLGADQRIDAATVELLAPR